MRGTGCTSLFGRTCLSLRTNRVIKNVTVIAHTFRATIFQQREVASSGWSITKASTTCLVSARSIVSSAHVLTTSNGQHNGTTPNITDDVTKDKMANDAAEAAREERLAMIMQQMFGGGGASGPPGMTRDPRAAGPIVKPTESVCAELRPPPDAISLPRKLTAMNFDNTFVRQLPGDGITENYVRQVRGVCFSRVETAPMQDARLLHASEDAAALIDLDKTEFGNAEFAEYFSGNKRLPGGESWAHTYAGHQFGSWAGQLGDGRAISLGEVVNGRGERWELQLKGAGKTPYSRFADGRAVLRSSIREYLCSEAMRALGVPTSRALSLVGGSDRVIREEIETAAVVCRMAPSWVRFGSFQHQFHFKRHESLKQLADYVMRHHFGGKCDAAGNIEWTQQDAYAVSAPDSLKALESPYTKMLREVTIRTARAIAHWQAVGFVHGVMNTDNLSILGLTIDYGPFGFIDAFDPDAVINHSDETGHYSYQRQPAIGAWNLEQLAVTFTPLVGDDSEIESAIGVYWDAFNSHYMSLMRAKLGLRVPRDDDAKLVTSALEMLATHKVDYTLFFRLLSNAPAAPAGTGDGDDFALGMAPADAHPVDTHTEHGVISARGTCGTGGASRFGGCDAANGQDGQSSASHSTGTAFVPRSVSQLFPDTASARGDLASWLAAYRERIAVDGADSHSARKARMDSANPKYILRNWMAEEVIRRTKAGDVDAVAEMHAILVRPYDEHAEMEARGYASPAPVWARGIAVSCSS